MTKARSIRLNLEVPLSMNLPSKKEPPLPGPLLHKYVEERGMERRARVHGFNARMFREISPCPLPTSWGEGIEGQGRNSVRMRPIDSLIAK